MVRCEETLDNGEPCKAWVTLLPSQRTHCENCGAIYEPYLSPSQRRAEVKNK
jgi:hypothetical protein